MRSQPSVMLAGILTLAMATSAAADGTGVNAVLVADKGGPVHAACRPWLEGVIAGAGWKLLPADTDPVAADVVVSIKLTVHGRGPRRGAALEVNAFETATATKVAAAAELGRPLETADDAIDQVCKSVADQLTTQLSAWNAQVARRGLPISLSFRFQPELRPAPAAEIGAFLKASGLTEKPSASSPRQVRFVIHTKQAPDAFKARLDAFLGKHWKFHQGPPSNLPGNPRILIYVLQIKK